MAAVVAASSLSACSDTPGGVGEPGERCALATVSHRDAPIQTGAVRPVHDPAIIEQEDRYFVFSTNDGIPIRRSADLIHWDLA